MRVEQVLSEGDLARVRRAVEEAERRTAGEIVPYLVDASDDYGGALWQGAALGALGGCLAAFAAHFLTGVWGGSLLLWSLLPTAGGGALGWLAVLATPSARRWLTPGETLSRRVEMRAAAAFVECEVFATRERTGVLLFVSLLEHEVLVMADSGIHGAVEQATWDRLAAELAAGIRDGRAADALVEAVGKAGEILERRGVERRADDVNELPDAPRLGDPPAGEGR